MSLINFLKKENPALDYFHFDKEYYYLKLTDVIQEGDEYEMGSTWEKSNLWGQPPSKSFKYRRKRTLEVARPLEEHELLDPP